MSNTLTVSVRQLQSALLCAADADVRYYLNGVLVEAGEGVTRVVGTDGHMLVAHDWKHGDRDQWRGSFIIPRATIDMLKLKIGRDNYEHCTIEVDETITPRLGLTLRFKEVSVQFTNVDGVFPDYTRVFPSTLTHGEFWNCPSSPDGVPVMMTDLNIPPGQSWSQYRASMTVDAGRVARVSEALNEAQRVQQFASDKYATLIKLGKVFSKQGNFRMWHYPSAFGSIGLGGGAVVTFSGVPVDHTVACIVMPLRDDDRLTPPVVSEFRSHIFVAEKSKEETEQAA